MSDTATGNDASPVATGCIALQESWAALSGAALLFLLIWGVVALLPVLPWPLLVLVWLALAAPTALAAGWAASVASGHSARVFNLSLRRAFFRGGIRVVLVGLAALAAMALMALRLVQAEPTLWLAAALTVLAPALLLPRLAPELDRVGHSLHGLRAGLRLTVLLSAASALLLHLALTWAIGVAPEAQPAPVTASALLGEALTLAHLWAGMEAYALGLAAEFGSWARLGALVLTSAGLFAGLVALALAGAAATLALSELGRALAPASDDMPAPAPGRAGIIAAALLAAALIVSAGLIEQRLARTPVEARPATQLQTTAERIGDAFFRPGTYDQIDALRREVLAQDAALAGELAAAIAAGFDAMEANVDPFLDSYYSMSAEYWRLAYWVTGGLEAHLQRHLEEELNRGEPLAGVLTLLDTAMPEIEARHAALTEHEAALLAANRIEGTNPGLLRVDERFPALPAFDSRLLRGLGNFEPRWGVAAGAGLVSGAIAARVAQRLAARGVLRGAGLVLSRFAGLPVALGVDYLLLRADAAQNREAFRTEILAEIDMLRREALAGLASEEGDGTIVLAD